VYQKSFTTLKAKFGASLGERVADARAKSEFSDLHNIAEKAEGIIKVIERISANYKTVLEWREAELNQFGKRS
jgi:hypothetical protein